VTEPLWFRLAQYYWRILRVRAFYANRHGRAPALFRPRRYTEKLQWRKLFDLDPRYTVLVDKLAARGFIAARVGEGKLVPLLWAGSDPNAIPFDRLTPPYVLKSAHGSGHVIMVDGRGEIDRAAVRATAWRWLGQCYGSAADEPAYVAVPRRLLVEPRLSGPDGGAPLEHNFFVFHGRVVFLRTRSFDRAGTRFDGFHDPDWNPLPWSASKAPVPPHPIPRPALLGEMSSAAVRLAAGFDFLRVDTYDGGARFWVGEITVYPGSGRTKYQPDEVDRQLGAQWVIRRPLRRALWTMLTRTWGAAGS
jgi:hypothetical protein